MADPICVDSSLALIQVIPEPRTPLADILFRRWESTRVRLLAPPLFNPEATSVIRQKVFDRRLTTQQGEWAFAASLRWSIRITRPPNLQHEAWSFAKTVNQRRAYDAQYLALANILGIEFWTGDQRLYNASQQAGLSWVHSVEEVVL